MYTESQLLCRCKLRTPLLFVHGLLSACTVVVRTVREPQDEEDWSLFIYNGCQMPEMPDARDARCQNGDDEAFSGCSLYFVDSRIVKITIYNTI